MSTNAWLKQQDQELARRQLDYLRGAFHHANPLLLISQELGKGLTDYYKITFITTTPKGGIITQNLTWAIAKGLGFSLRDRHGYWYLALGGGNYSKPLEIARTVAHFYGLEKVRFEIV